MGWTVLPALTSCAVSWSRVLRLPNSPAASLAVARALLDSGKMPWQGRPVPQALLLSRGQSSPSHRAGVHISTRKPPQIWGGRLLRQCGHLPHWRDLSALGEAKWHIMGATALTHPRAKGAAELAVLVLQELCTGTRTDPALPSGADSDTYGTAQMTGECDHDGEEQPELCTCTAALNAHTQESNTRSASSHHPSLEHKQRLNPSSSQ